MKNLPYSAIGGIFEYLNVDCGYEQWSQYLINKLKSCGAGKTGADIGCGNGYFTRVLTRAGYSVKGMDISPEMLSEAVKISAAEGTRTEFLLGDITKLTLSPKVDFITAINDCLNYVPQNKLLSTFKKVNSSLKKGGIFIFDISSENKLKNVLGNNLFADDGENITYIWFNSLKEDRVEMDLTLFIKNSGGSYKRSDESHTQYIHGEKTVVDRLNEAGFSVETEGHLGKSKEDRINFICRKI